MKHRDILRRLTLFEKCCLLSGRAYWHTVGIGAKGVPAVCLSDGPHGVRRQAGRSDRLGIGASLPATCFPTASALACSWDPSLLRRVGAAIGREAAAQGVGVLLGPGLNLKRTPLCGRNFEYFSEDPLLSGRLAAGYVRGVQQSGVAACVKHFAANNLEWCRQAADSVVDIRTLRELYLTGFEIAVREASPKCVMTAYNRVNGAYANENRALLADVLRGEWGFDGAVMSDWGGGNDVAAGVLAGCNLEMPGTAGESPAALLEAVRAGRLPEAVVDERVDQLLDVALSVRPEAGGSVDAGAHHALAREACADSAVLVRNEGGLLPLKAGTRVALIGAFARDARFQGAGSSAVNPTRVDSMLDEIGNTSLRLEGFAPGWSRQAGRSAALREEAVALARRAEAVVLALGLGEADDQEGQDRRHMRLPEEQVALLRAVRAANPNVAVVLFAGSPVETPWLEHCQALLVAGLCGQAGAGALLDVLCGNVNPSGRLAESWPLRYEDCPAARWLPPEGLAVPYREGLFVGYRYYQTAGVPVRFPFGFGLGYTQFRYDDLAVTAKGVAFTLTNVGERAGAEVVQLYVGLPVSKLYRPARELKGFEKVWLAPGEARRVTLPFDDYTFRAFDAGEDRFRVEGGAYAIMVGASAADIRLTGTLRVAGDGELQADDAGTLPHYFAGDPLGAGEAEFERLLGRPLPKEAASGAFGMNDPVCRLAKARSLKARLLCRLLAWLLRRGEARGKPMLALRSLYEMPPRALGKASGGVLNQRMCRGLCEIANGHALAFFKGLGGVIAGAAEQARNRRRVKRELP